MSSRGARRLLFLCSRLPWPPDRGDRLTAWHWLRTLAGTFDVTLLSMTTGAEPPAAAAALRDLGVAVEVASLAPSRSWAQAWLALPGRTPSQVAYYRSAHMQSAVDAAIARLAPDVILVQLIRMAPYVAAVDHSVKVLFLADSLGLALARSAAYEPAWKRPGVAWERSRVERFEAEVSHHFRESWVVSDVDREALERRGAVRVRTMRHGVEESLFDLERREPERLTAVFLGNLSVPHNRDAALYAAREIWPRLRQRDPDARLVLVGAGAGPEVTSLGRLPGVEVRGFVPDPRDIWRSASLLIAPLRYATGIQNKVLEAMAAGVPVVATPGVAEGIGARAGEHLDVACSVPELVAAVLRVREQRDLALARAARARAFVKEHFRWEFARDRILELLAESPASHPGRSRSGARAS